MSNDECRVANGCVRKWRSERLCGPRVVPHPQRLCRVENALDLHTIWLRPAAAGPEAPRSARARRMLKRSPSILTLDTRHSSFVITIVGDEFHRSGQGRRTWQEASTGLWPDAVVRAPGVLA